MQLLIHAHLVQFLLDVFSFFVSLTASHRIASTHLIATQRTVLHHILIPHRPLPPLPFLLVLQIKLKTKQNTLFFMRVLSTM